MLSFLSLIRKPWLLVAVAVLGAFAGGFWRGFEAGSDSERVSQLEAQLAAERDRARREAALAKRLEREKSELQNALDTIDAETPIEGAGDSCRLDPDFMQQLAKRYGQNWRGDPPVPEPNQ